jgi:hypothetical protein
LAELQRQADEEGDLDWHLAGQERPDLEAEALDRGRGGFSTKVHVRAEGGGKPMALLVTAGQRPEQVVFTQINGARGRQAAVPRPGGG